MVYGLSNNKNKPQRQQYQHQQTTEVQNQNLAHIIPHEGAYDQNAANISFCHAQNAANCMSKEMCYVHNSIWNERCNAGRCVACAPFSYPCSLYASPPWFAPFPLSREFPLSIPLKRFLGSNTNQLVRYLLARAKLPEVLSHTDRGVWMNDLQL